MDSPNQCPSCGTKLNSLVMNHSMVGEKRLELINTILRINENQRCSKCISPFVEEARETIYAVEETCKQEIQKGLDKIPIATIQVPPKWDFEVIGIVTGQSTTGTGVFSEIFSDFTDFFGAQSETYNNKLRHGETLCASQIKFKTLQLGGNAIVGVDIDYSEVGGGKGMLMVCMAGTAVNLKNIREVLPAITDEIDAARKANEVLTLFGKFKKAFPNTLL